MKVLVVNNAVPFIRGGAEELADNLVANLNTRRGVEAELMRLPFHWEPSERLIDEIVMHQAFQLSNVDRVIALKFPAYLVPHHDKTLWLLHQFRQAYDLREAGQSPLGHDGASQRIVGAIRCADDMCFDRCRRIFVNSPVTRDRLQQYNSRASEVLYPPLNDEALFGGGDDNGYIFAGGRVSPGKRQALLVEAMAATKAPVRLVIAGPPENQATADALRQRVEELELTDRVELRFGFLPRTEIAELANKSRACAYIPFDEDSLGYVTMEAFAAGKPVLTTTDSGGLLEMVRHGETGWMARPNAESLAEGLGALTDPATAARLGRAASAEWRSRGLTWPKTIETLLS